MIRELTLTSLAGTLLLAALPARADVTTYVGATLTSDYIFDGETQTDGNPAVQPYVELEWPSGLYAGVWASNVDFGDADSVEIDLYAGYRGEAGALSYDVSYYRYIYDSSGDCCGEIVFDLGYALGETVSMNTTFKADLEGGASVTQAVAIALPADFEAAASYKVFNRDGGEAWTVGVSKALSDTVSLDMTWHDASYVDDGTLTLAISFDTDLASLLGR